MAMKKKNKVYLIFSIVYWLLIATSLILFGFAFGKVGINKYGLLRNFYNSWIDNEAYISGLYHVGIGNYFVQFPSSKVYLIDQKLNLTNLDMNSMQVTYTLVYRIVKNQVYNLYQALSTSYEGRIISSINSIISNYFINVNQQSSRVSRQTQLITEIKNKFGDKVPILKSAIIIQGFWLNQIDFFSMESIYQTAFLQVGTFSQAYQAIQIEKMKTDMELQILRNLITDLRNKINLTSNLALRNASLAAQSSSQFEVAQRKVLLSNNFQSAQLFQYYRPPRVNFS